MIKRERTRFTVPNFGAKNRKRVKGQDVTIKGVDKYDVGQTIANIRKGCYSRGYDTRVFQDGLYVVNEE